MKRTYIAAASLLLLGTSALAWTPTSEPVAQAKDPVVFAKSESKDFKDVKVAKADAAIWSTQEAQLQPASLQTWDQPDPDAADPDLGLAEDPGMTDAVTGMGGPDETLDVAADSAVTTDTAATTLASADSTPRPAAHNYPPCDPGPGDDNCIQLYEPGVHMALASWNQPTGGLLDDQATTAMGGPYEPVDGPSEVAMNGDGLVDPALGETAALEGAQTTDYAGVGGPIAETGYPPCSPGPGDDRCIQLYERGVTGAGN